MSCLSGRFLDDNIIIGGHDISAADDATESIGIFFVYNGDHGEIALNNSGER